MLGPGRFRLYGLSEYVMAATTILAIPLSLPNCTIQTSLTSRLKVEPSLQSITILSDDSNMSSSLHATPSKNPSQISHLFDPPHESPGCPSNSSSQLGLKQPRSIVDYLRKFHASKRSRNALNGLDYNAIKLLRADFLPLVFNGDVVSCFPWEVLSGICNPNSWWEWTSDMMDMLGPKLLHHTSRMIWA